MIRALASTILLWVLLFTGADPLSKCNGPAMQVSELNGYTFTATVRWQGYVCAVEIETVEGMQIITEDTLSDYMAIGFGTSTVSVVNCPNCSPIRYARVYYNLLDRQVFLPMVQR